MLTILIPVPSPRHARLIEFGVHTRPEVLFTGKQTSSFQEISDHLQFDPLIVIQPLQFR